jgi:hypothetical protein
MGHGRRNRPTLVPVTGKVLVASKSAAPGSILFHPQAGTSLVNRLRVELEAGRQSGDIGVVWINSETFYQLRQIKALYGPFTDWLPNNRFVSIHEPNEAGMISRPRTLDDRRSPTLKETFGRAFRRGQETRAEQENPRQTS